MSQTQQKYSTFDRELLAAYLAVLHFKHLVEGRNVLLLTNQKPLCRAFKSQSSLKSDRQQRYKKKKNLLANILMIFHL